MWASLCGCLLATVLLLSMPAGHRAAINVDDDWNVNDDHFRDEHVEPMPPLMRVTSTSFDVVHAPMPLANVSAQRRGKFFFDALFGLGTAVVNSGTGAIASADDDEDGDDDDEDDEVSDDTKQCNCRESDSTELTWVPLIMCRCFIRLRRMRFGQSGDPDRRRPSDGYQSVSVGGPLGVRWPVPLWCIADIG